jgi:methionyl-tRNA synthetase
MAPLELFCRGGDPRAMKGFIAACLSGAEVKFTPMTAAVSGETRGAPIKLGELTDANAIARFLGNRGALKDAFVPGGGPERWAVERWTEWETLSLAPAVALACAAKDAAPVVTMLRQTLDVRLREVGFGDENGLQSFVSIAGGTASKTTRTLADVVVVSALFPLLGENRASGVRGVEGLADDLLVVSWFESFFDTSDELMRAQILSALDLSKASAVASYNVAANDGAALLLRSLSSLPPTDPSKEKFCVTTAINYANGAPHMGHAYEAVSSDVIARYHRLYGRDVLFQTGSDEHGQKIAEAAAAAGCKPIDLCDKHVALFQALNAKINVSNDVYNRTTSDVHKAACCALFERSKKNGDIYLDTYEGWYNVREETFVTDADAEAAEYKDPVSGKPLTKMSEESYFFRQSRYQKQLVEHIEANPEFIQPTRRRNEILARLREDELRDLSVSRTTFDWGIPVPDAPGHVLYVWFDALTNYLTGAGWPENVSSDDFSKTHWPASVHIIGKDIIWFHCVIWPCMLWSAGLPLPTTVFGHGFVMAADGQKMSKSIGNVVDPMEQLERYSSDTFRYYLMRGGVYGSDIPFSEPALVLTHNSDLADVLGNLVHRATNLCLKNCGGVVPAVDESHIEPVVDVPALRAHSEMAMKHFETHKACELAINAVKDANKYLTESAPWAVKGDGAEKRKAVIIRSVLEAVYVAAHFLAPVIPDAAAAIFEKLGTPATPIWRLKKSANLAAGTKVAVGDILFAKHEVEGETKMLSSGERKKEKGEKSEKSEKSEKAKKPAPADAPVDVSRLCLKVGTVTKVWRHPDAEKLYVETIDVGEKSGPRQVVSGLVDHVPEAEMLGKRVVVVANMKPSKMRGVESTAMVLCGTGSNGKVEPLEPPSSAPNGAIVACASFPGEPDDVLNPKKKVFEAVSPDFSVLPDGVAAYKGTPLLTGGEACRLPTLREGTIK